MLRHRFHGDGDGFFHDHGFMVLQLPEDNEEHGSGDRGGKDIRQRHRVDNPGEAKEAI